VKPVSIMWTQGVDTAEAQLVVAAVRDFLRQVYAIGHQAGLALPPTTIRPFGTWYIPSQPEGSPYWGTHWYIDNSFDSSRQQVIGARFLELVREEPWQKSNPHWDVAVIDRDLIDKAPQIADEGYAEFALGASIPELATVLSVYRLRGLVRLEQRERALRRLVLHQFGQVLGLPSRSRQSGIETVGGCRFCTNRCVMRRASTVEQLVVAAEQDRDSQVVLCDQCRHDIIEIMIMRGRSPN
jgi:predicted Zn-dependent protease